MQDEIWIIQINPKTCKTIPCSTQEIIDRRNEMIGNESLFQDIQKIELINSFIHEGAFTRDFRAKYRKIKIEIVEMSPELQERLGHSSKLNRNRKYISDLLEDGEKQGKKFIQSQS